MRFQVHIYDVYADSMIGLKAKKKLSEIVVVRKYIYMPTKIAIHLESRAVSK